MSTHISQPGEHLNGQRLVRVTGSTVERAGTCLDGDGCSRWHCRACHRYWLGASAHSCDAPVPALEHKICGWMKEALQQDHDVATSTRKVLLRVKAAGLGEALLDAYGDHLIAMVWRENRDDDDEMPDQSTRIGTASRVLGQAQTTSNSPDVSNALDDGRWASSETHQVAGAAVNGAAASNHVAQVPRGVRWMDVKRMATDVALLECLYPIDGRWIRLGDLNKRQCRVLQRQYGAAADAFGQLAASLAERQIVRQRWTAEQLEDLVGDTLRGAAPARPNQI